MTDYVVVWYCGKLTKGETFNRTGKIISQSMALMQTHTQTHTHTHTRTRAHNRMHTKSQHFLNTQKQNLQQTDLRKPLIPFSTSRGC